MSGRLLISTTRRLRFLGIFFLLLIPIVLYELHFILNVPTNSWIFYTPFVPIIGLAVLLMRGSFLFLWVSLFLQILWIAFNVMLFLEKQDPALAYLLLMFVLVCWFVIIMASYHYREPYVQPRLRWYQSLPESIPGVLVLIQINEDLKRLSVGGLNKKGVYLYFSSSPNERIRLQEQLKVKNLKRPIELSLVIHEQKIDLLGRIIRFLPDGRGFGLEFIWKNNDNFKDYRSALNELRERGYVE